VDTKPKRETCKLYATTHDEAEKKTFCEIAATSRRRALGGDAADHCKKTCGLPPCPPRKHAAEAHRLNVKVDGYCKGALPILAKLLKLERDARTHASKWRGLQFVKAAQSVNQVLIELRHVNRRCTTKKQQHFLKKGEAMHKWLRGHHSVVEDGKKAREHKLALLKQQLTTAAPAPPTPAPPTPAPPTPAPPAARPAQLPASGRDDDDGWGDVSSSAHHMRGHQQPQAAMAAAQTGGGHKHEPKENDKFPQRNGAPAAACKVSAWSSWSSCGAQTGQKRRSRHALVTVAPCTPRHDFVQSSVCTVCLAGQYQNAHVLPGEGAASHCVSCVSGRYSSERGAAKCQGDKCPLGKFGPMRTQTAANAGCFDCPAGQFGSALGAGTCTHCALGHWQSRRGAEWCHACPAGKHGARHVPKTSAHHCRHCSKRKERKHHTAKGAAVCYVCASGKAAKVDSGGQCVKCVPGRFQDEVSSAASCKPCPARQWQPHHGATECMGCSQRSSACPTGKFAAYGCTPTSDRECGLPPRLGGIGGTTNYIAGSAPTTLAPAATCAFDYAVSSAAVSIVAGARPGDAISFAGDQGSIDATFKGVTLTLVSGKTSSLAYEAALRAVKFRASGTDAPPMRSVTLEFSICHSAAVCHRKRMVVWVFGAGHGRGQLLSVRSVAPTVVYTLAGPPILVAAHCVPVAPQPHTWLRFATVTLHEAVAGDTLAYAAVPPSHHGGIVGTFDAKRFALRLSGKARLADYEAALRAVSFSTTALSTRTRSISIVIADGLEKSSSMSLVRATICTAAGFFANAKAHRAERCPQGKHQEGKCASACTGCASGEFGDSSLATNSRAHCKHCAKGRYSDHAAADHCVGCAAGRKGGTRAQSSVSHCEQCIAGRFALQHAQVACALCSSGRYSSSAGSAVCSKCAAGRYQHEEGRRFCLKCAAGKSNAHEASEFASACAACETGTYAHKAGAAECKTWACCAADTFNPTCSTTAMGVCVACPHGRSRPGKSCVARHCHSRVTPSNCREGSGLRDKHCVKCPRGTYKHGKSGSTCADCPPGKFGHAQGAAACADCPDGKYSMRQAGPVTWCHRCEGDTYGAHDVPRTSPAHCKACDTIATKWGAWLACDGKGLRKVKFRTRAIGSHHPPGWKRCSTSKEERC
jgi:hypothetical protein